MAFNRPPRILPSRPRESVRLPAPPQLPREPGAFRWMTILLPLGGILLMVFLMVSIGGGGGTMYLLSLPMMMGGYAVSYFAFRSQKKDYRDQVAEGKLRYARNLQKIENHLYSLREREQTALRAMNPPLAACLDRARRQSPRLGERRPSDPDFLMPRLGSGRLPSATRIESAESDGPPPELTEEAERARELAEKFAVVPDVPITARLPHTGSVGIAGERSDVLRVARSLLCHLLVHHWFSEVQVAALCEDRWGSEWNWLSAAPHAFTAFAWPKSGIRFADPDSWTSLADLEKELIRRKQILDARRMIGDESTTPPLPCLVIVVDFFPQEFSHPALDMLLGEGKALGVFAFFLTPQAAQIPGDCGAVIEVRPGNLTYREAGTDATLAECRPDLCDPALAESISKALSHVKWSQQEDLSQPPARITFLEMLGVASADDLPVETWWNVGSPFGFLQAPIGRSSATSDFLFDLRDQDGSHGPHGLLGGMTGSGKSEVLKTLILALAAATHPYDLNFALVDYKGGAAFNELARLPHTVGVMTDIESHGSYAERMLLALGGELERRKRILERARSVFHFGRSHVDDYRTMRVRQPLPHLVVVFDEFAEFKNRHPEESKRLISIARLGRSLGVHLILATQNIQAAIDPQILQNTNFRVCLRTSQPEDSLQMIGIPDAIHLVRGRAYFYSTGRQLVQIAYCGGKYRRDAEADPPEHLVVVHPDGRKETVAAPRGGLPGSPEISRDPRLTEADAVVDRLNRAMRRLNLRKPGPVWTDPLPDRLYLPDVFRERLTGGWDGKTWHPCRKWDASEDRGAVSGPILGIRDLPQQQRQPLLELPLEEGGGHLLVFGSAASGKTTLLETLVLSIARMYSPVQAQIYILDFGGQSHLRTLQSFPHVGAVITRFEAERAQRVLHFLQSELKRRNDLFRRNGVGTIADFNRAVSADPLPELFLLIDHFHGLKRAFPPEFANEISLLAGQSGRSGIHIAAATYLPSDLPADLPSNVHVQVTLHQPTQTEYFGIVGMIAASRLQEDVGRPPRPGRGFLRGNPPVECQTALPVSGTDDREQRQSLAAVGAEMRRTWVGPTPPPVESLPYAILLPEGVRKVDPSGPWFSPQGMDFETLLPLGMDLDRDGPAFLVTGSSGGCGKTTALLTWALGLAERFAPRDLQFLFLDIPSRHFLLLKDLPHTFEYVCRPPEVEPCLNRLLAVLRKRSAALEEAFHKEGERFDRDAFLAAYPRYVLFVDDYDRFFVRCESASRTLAECLSAGGDLGLSIVVAGNAADLPKDYDDDLMKKVRRLGCGLLFSGNAAIDQFHNVKSPPYQPLAGLPPGRGYFIRKGTARIFQNFLYWEDGRKAADCLQERAEKILSEYSRARKSMRPSAD